MQTLQKRSSETVRFDVDCSRLLGATETISSVTSMAYEPATVPALTFGASSVNSVAQTYTDEFGSTRTAPIGQVIQVPISGGFIAAGAQVRDYVLRFVMATNLNAAVEATVRLKLNDTPAP